MDNLQKFGLGIVLASGGMVFVALMFAVQPFHPLTLVLIPFVIAGFVLMSLGLRAHWRELKRLDAEFKRTQAEIEKLLRDQEA